MRRDIVLWAGPGEREAQVRSYCMEDSNEVAGEDNGLLEGEAGGKLDWFSVQGMFCFSGKNFRGWNGGKGRGCTFPSRFSGMVQNS